MTTLEFPGFIDVHVHFRDPGLANAETTASGLLAASRGGFGAVVTMPNTSPATDSPKIVNYQREKAREAKSRTHLLVAGTLSRERLGREVANIDELAKAGVAFVTDDGSYISDDLVMKEAMRRAVANDLVVCDHAMDPVALANGVIRDCELARKFNLPTISVATETNAIRRDLSLCRDTGCKLHIQHISTAEGVELVRDAQREGLSVTAEATPHHLLLSCDDLIANDANFKMAPPLGNREDRAELRRAVKDGVLMFATDHAPHPIATKNLGFEKSANGIIGLETAIAITYGVMVEEEGMSVENWACAWWEMPLAILSRSAKEEIANMPKTVVAIGEKKTFDLNASVSMAKNCPYNGLKFSCWPKELAI